MSNNLITNEPLHQYEYKVLVKCVTYNHCKYIKQALDGFAGQKTNFPFVCLVMDDASTDGEQGVIMSWMEMECDMSKAEIYDDHVSSIFIVPHKDNVTCTFAFYLLKQNLYGTSAKDNLFDPWRKKCEFEALCEGDDYWVSKDKLQLQVDFLTTHKEYSMCSHRIYRYDQDSNILYKDCLNKLFVSGGCVVKNTSSIWLAETSSLVYRISADREYREYPKQKRDNIHVYFLLKNSLGYCMSNVMSVYRQHDGGIFSKQSINNRLVNGSYKVLKELYDYEKTKDARYLYYRSYANTFIKTKGRILSTEKFSLIKFLSLLFFIPTIIFMPHNIYKQALNK